MDHHAPAGKTVPRNGEHDQPQAPVVSVAVPVYNGERFLEESVESILAQTYQDFELILCDNASTDRTEEICRRFMERDGRVRYHRQARNVGASRNWNKAFALSRGRFFKWHADDDLLDPHYLERLVSILESDPGCVMAHPRTVLIDASGSPRSCYLDEIASDSDDPAERLRVWLRPSDGLCNPLFGLMRREIAAKTDLDPPYVSGDRVFLAHLTLLGRCRMLNEALFFRRMHGDRIKSRGRSLRVAASVITGRPRVLPVLQRWRLTFALFGLVLRTPLTASARVRAFSTVSGWVWRRKTLLVRELLLPLHLNGKDTRLGALDFPFFFEQ